MLKDPHNSWHRPRGITERYVILEGRGRVEVGDLPPEEVEPGAVVLIPLVSARASPTLGTPT